VDNTLLQAHYIKNGGERRGEFLEICYSGTFFAACFLTQAQLYATPTPWAQMNHVEIHLFIRISQYNNSKETE
jgi:hypothetical protein